MYSATFVHRYDMMKVFLSILFVLLSGVVFGQKATLDSALVSIQKTKLIIPQKDTIEKIMINDQLVSALITEGDTLFFAELGNINISSLRTFESREDYLKYLKYRRYAASVYPFAKEAIRIFREAEYVSENLKKRKRKRYLRKLSKELEKEFQDPLKGLSKTQGKILVKMIERELETKMFDLIKMTQGKLKAFYWNQSSKLYGYRLKTGYIVGQNPILDVVLQDFDISYQIAENL